MARYMGAVQLGRGIAVLALVFVGCGGDPKPAAPAKVQAAAPDAPDPGLANPCDAQMIDPSINPCAGTAAKAAATEAKAAEAPVSAP